MTKSIFLLFAVMCCLLSAYAGASLIVSGRTTDIYKGKLLLLEADYTDFKSQLAGEDVRINSITTVASEPAFVEFNVTVPIGYTFTFGEKVDQFRDWWLTLVPLLFATFFVGVYSWWPNGGQKVKNGQTRI